MAIYLGSDSCDLKIGTKTLLLSAIYLHDLTAYYQKQETYSRDEMISCLNGVLEQINRDFYSKEEISAIISGYEIEHRINFIQEKEGLIQTTNRVMNHVCPSADISVIMPRDILTEHQLGRNFFLRITQPLSAVDVDFVGYEGSDISFCTEIGSTIGEMDDGKDYLFYFVELSSNQFYVTQKELTTPTNVNLTYVEGDGDDQGLQLYDLKVNYLEISSYTRLIMPPRVADGNGWLPRDFNLYVIQPSDGTGPFDIEFVGNSSESLQFSTYDKTNVGSMETSSTYLFSLSEIQQTQLSAQFLIKQNKLTAV